MKERKGCLFMKHRVYIAYLDPLTVSNGQFTPTTLMRLNSTQLTAQPG